VVSAINALGEPGIAFSRGLGRRYPQRRLAAHFVGFTSIDGRAQAGVQRQVGSPGLPFSLRIETSLDARVQAVLEEELSRSLAAMANPRPDGAVGVVLDVNSGELLAMASYPNFDPNDRRTFTSDTLFNRATMGVYEFGASLAAFSISLNEADAGAYDQRAVFERLGMTSRVPVDLPETTLPLLPGRRPEGVSGYSAEDTNRGEAIAITPLHLANAYATLVNGGRFRPISVLRLSTGSVPPGRQALSAESSTRSRRFLRLVEQATSAAADAAGYRVGGMAGTVGYTPNQRLSAYEQNSSAYVRLVFAGAFPMDAPRYAIVVMFDGVRRGAYEPQAAPTTARRIIERIGPLLGIVPSPR
jgi:cell division protein FtsI (penicillin-binding protein 3)